MKRHAAALAAAGLALFAVLPASAQDQPPCGRVCIFSEPDFAGQQRCFDGPVEVPDLAAWEGFALGSVRIAPAPACVLMPVFYKETGMQGERTAVFNFDTDISQDGYRSLRIRRMDR